MTKQSFKLGNVVKSAVASPASIKSLIINQFNFSFMLKNRFNLRNVAMIACLAVFSFSANNALAQTVSYTDPSGVTCTYTYGIGIGDAASLSKCDNMPASVTKWVVPETITTGGVSYKVTGIASGAFGIEGCVVRSSTLKEVVFPKYMERMEDQCFSGFPNVRKLTFGENLKILPETESDYFADLSLDTIIFLGTELLEWGNSYYCNFNGRYGVFNSYLYCNDCNANVKIIVPCGTKDLFVSRLNEGAITAANFYEAECLNTLTVLSSDVILGNAWSMNGGMIITSTPSNTSADYSGTATLVALPHKDKVFTGWSDGNTDNPRTVTVSSDTTFTANFASCTETGIRSAQAASPLQVYPNPAAHTLTVQSEQWINNGTLTLFDMSGKAVLSQSINGASAQINISSLAAGNYILRVVENGIASAGVQVVKL